MENESSGFLKFTSIEIFNENNLEKQENGGTKITTLSSAGGIFSE